MAKKKQDIAPEIDATDPRKTLALVGHQALARRFIGKSAFAFAVRPALECVLEMRE